MSQFVPKVTWFLLVLGVCACAKKEPKPLRTEPWLAHPQASVGAAANDAALPTTRYALTEPSLVHFEIPSQRGALRGTLTRVSGDLHVSLSDLAHSSGQVRVDLSSLTIEGPAVGSDHTLLARARAALELTDARAGTASASFDLNELVDVTTNAIEPAPLSDAGTPFTRRARATAVGNLLLHGFRVVRRAPLEAEFGFTNDRLIPATVAIRSRAPFVVSLETHAVQALRPESNPKSARSAPAQVDEVRVSVELYGRKVD